MEAVCNRSVLLQEPAVYFTPSSSRCFWEARAGGARARGWEAGPVSTATLSPQASSAAHPRGGRPPACDAATGPKARGGGKGSGRRELRGRVRFPGAAGNSDSGTGNPFLAGAFSPGEAMCSARINLSPAHSNCLHLRRLDSREASF